MAQNYKTWLKQRTSMRRRSIRGAVTVELAVAVPVLALFTFSIIQYGMIMYTLNALSQVTRDAARYAAVHGTEALSDLDNTHAGSIRNYIKGSCTTNGISYSNIGDANVKVGTVDANGTFIENEVASTRIELQPIAIRVSYSMASKIFMDGLVPGVHGFRTGTVTRQSVMMLERVVS